MKEKSRTLFFLPAIHRLPTGGNVYNRKIIQALKPDEEIEVFVWEADSPAGWKSHDNTSISGSTVAIIDSLLIDHIEEIQLLWNQKSLMKRVLLVHYLHLIDPQWAHSEKARFEKEALQAFDGFVTTSHFSKEQLSLNGIPQERIAVIRPGLDPDYQKPVTHPDLAEVPQILTIGSMLPGKGLMELVEILADLQELPWCWSLAGEQSLDPEFYQQFQQRLTQAKIAERTRILGPLSGTAILSLYDQSHLFVLPSQFESCSMVTMEAKARGLPIMAYRVGGIPEHICDTNTGYLIPPGDVETFSKTLRSLLESPQERLVRRQAPPVSGHAFLNWDQVATQFHQWIHSISHGTS